jgi:formylglycine-generating enzyme required for sulfatase activity
LGLFDVLGNVYEWVEDPAFQYVTGQTEDIENLKKLVIDERQNRLFRGVSFFDRPISMRCALRLNSRPGYHIFTLGFRPVRTLLD